MANTVLVAAVVVPLIFGDSIAVQLGATWPHAAVGRGPQAILLELTQHDVHDRLVILSSGIINNTHQWEFVKRQLVYLQDYHARTVLLGVAPAHVDINQQLRVLAEAHGARFAGPIRRVASDGIHAASAADLWVQVRVVASDWLAEGRRTR